MRSIWWAHAKASHSVLIMMLPVEIDLVDPSNVKDDQAPLLPAFIVRTQHNDVPSWQIILLI